MAAAQPATSLTAQSMLSRHRCLTRLSLFLVVVLHMAFATRLFSTMSSATKNKGDNDRPTGRSPRRSLLSERIRSPRPPLLNRIAPPGGRSSRRCSLRSRLSVCLAVRLRLSSSVVFPSRQSQSATLFFLHGLGDSARGGWSDVVPEVSGSASAAQRSAGRDEVQSGSVRCGAAECAAQQRPQPADRSLFTR